MTRAHRPTQIAAILEMLRAEFPADEVASLETYLADLEARQPDRPDHIAAILKAVGSDHPSDTGASLEAYIADLEASQQVMPLHKAARSQDLVRLYWQGVKREQHLRQRALKKFNNYR
jgi:hypothetical protein